MSGAGDPKGRPVLLRLSEARFGYHDGRPVLQGVNLEIGPGDFCILTGSNGSGKSTLIRGLLGMAPMAEGITWSIPKDRIGYVPQEGGMEAGGPATALDVVRAARPLGWSGGAAAAARALERVGLGYRIHLAYASLSGGQKRRVLAARALVAEPAVLILDEPTANVDDETAERLESLLTELCAREGRAVLAAVHDPVWGRGARRLRIAEGGLHG